MTNISIGKEFRCTDCIILVCMQSFYCGSLSKEVTMFCDCGLFVLCCDPIRTDSNQLKLHPGTTNLPTIRCKSVLLEKMSL